MFQGFRVSGAFLVGPGRAWNAIWVRLERLSFVLEVSWGHLGAFWVDLGRVLSCLKGFLGTFCE